jgi:hypothetical protein
MMAAAKPKWTKIFIDGIEQTSRNIQAATLKGSTRTNVPFKLAAAEHDRSVNEFRHSGCPHLRPVAVVARGQPGRGANRHHRRQGTGKRTLAEKEELFGYYLGTKDEEYRRATDRVAVGAGRSPDGEGHHRRRHEREKVDARSLHPVPWRVRPVRWNKVVPGVRRATAIEGTAHEPSGLRDLADGRQPPAHRRRATVNRIWQELFGTGIVRTSEDFGISGELPSHPELLDWLAIEFRESGWDLERFYRRSATSSAYRQSALTTPEKREKDPRETHHSAAHASVSMP